MILALLTAAQLSAPPEGPASSDRLELSWEAPAGCPGSDQVRELLQGLSSGSHSPARVRGRIEPRGSGFAESLEIAVNGVVEQRVLESKACIELARATALLIAIALDPIVAVEGLERTSEAPSEIPELPAPARIDRATTSSPADTITSPAGSRRVDARSIRPRWLVDGNAVAGASWGTVPGVAGLVGAALGVERSAAHAPRLRLALEGRYTIPTTAAYSDRPALAAGFDLWALSPKGCLSPQARRLSLPACLGLELGSLRARASGTSDARTDRSAWIAATLDTSLRWRIRGPWVVSAGLGIGVPLRRERFHFDEHVDPTRLLYAVAPLTLTTLLGIGLQSP